MAAFLSRVDALGKTRAPGAARGRLMFALDATMSRQPTWDLACSLQAEMFEALPADGTLDVQLVYFRGFGECRASRWVGDAAGLARLMTGITVAGGNTQIGRILSHARAEQARGKVNALVYVGDAMEEGVDDLAQKAGELGLLGCPIFVFQEGHDPIAERAFREFARVSKGAYARFDASAPRELAALLRAVAAYATGGRNALKLQGTRSSNLLLEQLK
ncbi:MAG: VWA domain-containing protein [Devosia sp.]